MSGVVHPAGGGERHAMGASEVVIKVTGEDTGGAFFIAEVVLEAGFPGPPPHYHRTISLRHVGPVFLQSLGPLTHASADRSRCGMTPLP